MPTRLATLSIAATLAATLLPGAPAHGESAVMVRRLAVAGAYSATRPQHQWSPNGKRLVYVLDASGDYGAELFSVSRGGGTPVRLSAEMPMGDWPVAFAITPDSRTVLFVGANEVYQTDELYAVPIGGPAAAAVRLHQPLPPGVKVREELTLTPDGTRVLFLADLDSTGHHELWSTPIDGSAAPQRLSSPSMVAGGNVEPPIKLSPDGATVVFRADAAVDDRIELWSAPADGSAAPVRLNPPLGDHCAAQTFSITSRGLVIFTANPSMSKTELWSVPLAGPATAAIRLNQSLPSGGNVTGFALALGDSRVVYRADAPADNAFRLYSVGDGGSPAAVEVSTGMQALADVQGWKLSPDGAKVVYVADAVTNDVYSLWSVAMNPLGAPVRLHNGHAPAGGDVAAFAITADSHKVVYLGDLATDGAPSLYSVNFDATSPRALAHFAANADVSLSLTPDSLRAVLRTATPNTTGAGTYAWIRIDGSDGAPVSLMQAGVYSAVAGAPSPDGRAFAYRLGDGVSVSHLYKAERTWLDAP